MRKKELDRRVRKTKNAVTSALLQLMKEKPITNITISELTKKADVNRKTFYNHYDSLEAVVTELEANCTNWVLRFFKDMPIENVWDNPASFFVAIAEGIKRHEDLFVEITEAGLYAEIAETIKNNIISAIREKLSDDVLDARRTAAIILLEFVVSGAVEIYKHMFDSENPMSLESIKNFFEFFFRNQTFITSVRK